MTTTKATAALADLDGLEQRTTVHTKDGTERGDIVATLSVDRDRADVILTWEPFGGGDCGHSTCDCMPRDIYDGGIECNTDEIVHAVFGATGREVTLDWDVMSARVVLVLGGMCMGCGEPRTTNDDGLCDDCGTGIEANKLDMVMDDVLPMIHHALSTGRTKARLVAMIRTETGAFYAAVVAAFADVGAVWTPEIVVDWIKDAPEVTR